MTDNTVIDVRAFLAERRQAQEEAAARWERHRLFFLSHAERQSAFELRLIEMDRIARRSGFTNMIRIVG